MICGLKYILNQDFFLKCADGMSWFMIFPLFSQEKLETVSRVNDKEVAECLAVFAFLSYIK